MSPTARTLSAYRQLGCWSQVVERYNMFSRRRIDLFGFLDGVSMDPVAMALIGWQATTGGNLQSRIDKIRGPCRLQARLWLDCGGKVEVWGWRTLLATSGGKARRWEPRVVEITVADVA